MHIVLATGVALHLTDRQLRNFCRKVKQGRGDDCWEWQGQIGSQGYGVFNIKHAQDKKKYALRAHRIAAILDTGQQLPPGLVHDHKCRNRACVRPSHLEVVTVAENTRRGNGPAGLNARKTHCPQGHELAGDNLVPSRKARHCRTCRAETNRRYRQRKTAA